MLLLSYIFKLFTVSINYSLFLQLRLLRIPRCAAPGVGNVGDDIVRLFEHPVVTPGNGVVRVDGLDPLREHGVGVVIEFRFLARHIGQCIEPRSVLWLSINKRRMTVARHSP